MKAKQHGGHRRCYIYIDGCESCTFSALNLEAHTVSDDVSCFEVNFYCRYQQTQKCWLKLGSHFDL